MFWKLQIDQKRLLYCIIVSFVQNLLFLLDTASKAAVNFLPLRSGFGSVLFVGRFGLVSRLRGFNCVCRFCCLKRQNC